MDVVSGILKPLLGRPADTIIKDLSTNSRHLQELDQLLRFTLNKIDVYSFYELLPMHPMKKPVVERHSALLNIPSEYEQIGLEADHRQMCKPPDRSHPIYETIAQRVITIMNRQIEKAQYSSDLIEMTNKFFTKQIEHISVLKKELGEDQTGPDVPMLSALVQQSSTFHVKPTWKSGAPDTHGLEEVADSLPIQKVKVFVDGMQRLMDRADSLQDMIMETERQYERRKAQARIEAERRINEQQIQELTAENARLKERLVEGNSGHAAPSCPTGSLHESSRPRRRGKPKSHNLTHVQTSHHLPPQASQSRQDMQKSPQMTTVPLQLQQPLGYETVDPEVAQEPILELGGRQKKMMYFAFEGRLHLSKDADSLDPVSPSGGGEHKQDAASVSDHARLITDSPGSGLEPTQHEARTKARAHPVPLEESMPARARGASTGHEWSPVPMPEHREVSRGGARQIATVVRLEPDVSMSPPTKKRKAPYSSSLPAPAFADPPEAHQVKLLSENKVQMVHMIGALNDMLRIGQLVLKSGEPAWEPTEP